MVKRVHIELKIFCNIYRIMRFNTTLLLNSCMNVCFAYPLILKSVNFHMSHVIFGHNSCSINVWEI